MEDLYYAIEVFQKANCELDDNELEHDNDVLDNDYNSDCVSTCDSDHDCDEN